MSIITVEGTEVYTINEPRLNIEEVYRFLDDQGLAWPSEPLSDDSVSDAGKVTELAGRNCYMSFGNKAGRKTNQSYINNLIGLGRDGPAHGSVVEHCQWTFAITGIDRGVSHELVRHRVGTAFSQLSTRYCDFRLEPQHALEGQWVPKFVIPPAARNLPGVKDALRSAYRDARFHYMRIAELAEKAIGEQPVPTDADGNYELPSKTTLRKQALGIARRALPLGTEVIMAFSANARTLWNVANLRTSPAAEWDIRELFVKITQAMEMSFPELFNDIVYKQVWDGSPSLQFPRDKL